METKTSMLIAAVPARVWRALRDRWELQTWACEQAVVDTESYRLEGPTLPLGGVGGRLLELREQELIRFEAVGGSGVEVRLEAVPQEGMPPADFTRVEIRHTGIPADSLPGAKFVQESWECVWTLLLRHLRGWCERAEAPGRFDFTQVKPPAVERSLIMDAPSGRVWRAIMDPAIRAKWMPGIEFGRVLREETGRLVLFDWPQYSPSQVLWELEALEDGKTLVTVREEVPESAWDHHLGWHDFLVGLYQETQRHLVRQTAWIKAAPEKVWQFLSTEEGMRRWWNSGMTYEPHVGGRVYFHAHGSGLGGRVVALEPERRLAFSWTEYDNNYPDPEPLLLNLELAPENGGTRVTLTHSGFENLPESWREKEFRSYQRGWAPGESVLRLKGLVESDAA